MSTPLSLINFFRELDFEAVTVRRPANIVFFCGGRFSDVGEETRTLRHYLLRERNIGARLSARVVLAETANQLYRDSEYRDLITFEEDIATVACLVLIIVESAGSLAELGAFATSDIIRPSTAIIIKSDFENSESFVRFGPVQKLLLETGDRVAFYPWKCRKDETIIKSSVKNHVQAITSFINAQLRAKPNSFLCKTAPSFKIFAVLFWVIHLSKAISISEIETYLNDMGEPIDRKNLKNKLYCLKVVGWIDKYSYGNKEYWHPLVDADPISRYVYVKAAKERNTARRKLEVLADIRKDLKTRTHVAKYVNQHMERPK
ncbi:hypothetical protein IHQ71_27015 [Rhizobium sp. TH2]|uniref:retron St85 family effector protein n=1 Tax=Rhizobium sp. TH2 TaxID=2775403 RepID=UPI0021572935|nr:retron St85 family effector protein [Rhizobium sp. TH2]UVC08734.1 hypothetical protein IHQ71_27015 [Rhizobium sp. TH2]